MNYLLSVVVPIYNVEKYLKKCLDSIINQTYKNLEIILVDDGSTDCSGKIADEYGKKDKRIKVIHKKNGGLADARNVGIDNASGKYIAFVDSDDWIDLNTYSESIKTMEKHNSDMFVFRAISCYSDTEINIFNNNNFIEISNDKIFDYWSIVGRGVCDKIFLKKYWDDIRFPFGKTSEDVFVIYLLMAKAQHTILSSNIYYYYRQRAGSISKIKNVRIDSYEAYTKAKDFIYKNYPNSYNIFMKNYVTNCMGLYNSIILYDNKNKWKKLMLEEIKKYKKFIFKSDVGLYKKVQVICLLYFKMLYYIIMKIRDTKINKKLYIDKIN